jgi:hypothetical protein
MAKRIIKKKEDTNSVGCPTKYKPEYNDQAYKLCLLGATDKDLADFFEVVEDTINEWKKKHAQLSVSVKEGKLIADMEVAHSMFKNTMDREVTEMKAIKVKEVSYNKAGKRVEKETVKLVPETRVIPADFRNQSLWLRNRKPSAWKDKQEIDHTTNGQPINMLNLGEGDNPEEEADL